jgi:hypothetical protein
VTLKGTDSVTRQPSFIAILCLILSRIDYIMKCFRGLSPVSKESFRSCQYMHPPPYHITFDNGDKGNLRGTVNSFPTDGPRIRHGIQLQRKLQDVQDILNMPQLSVVYRINFKSSPYMAVEFRMSCG